MKKLLISTLCLVSFALTACDKKPQDTKAGGVVGNSSQPATASLSNNNISDIKNDLLQLQTLNNTQAQETANFQTEVIKAAQSGKVEEVRTVVDKMQAFVDGFNKNLDNIPLKSTEVSALKDKIKQSNNLGLELAQAGIANPPDITKINELQKKGTDLQKDILTEMQNLQTKANNAK
nr:hypothetical protein [Acinetobacter sp. Marseille-Q1620]